MESRRLSIKITHNVHRLFPPGCHSSDSTRLQTHQFLDPKQARHQQAQSASQWQQRKLMLLSNHLALETALNSDFIHFVFHDSYSEQPLLFHLTEAEIVA